MASPKQKSLQFGLKTLFGVVCLAALLSPGLSALITDTQWALMILLAGLNLAMLALIVMFVWVTLLPFDLHLRSRSRKWRGRIAAKRNE